MSGIAVFGYGSLVSAESAERTLGREVEVLPARLRGWRRRWTLVRDNLKSEKTFAREPGGEIPPYMMGLNIEGDETGADPDLAPNGALIEVSEGEVERLDVRELRYDRVDVTAQIVAERGFDRVYSYEAKAEHHAAQPPEGAVIIARYLRIVQLAFEALGPGEWETFLATTGPPPVEQIEAVLVRDEIPPGNPREW
jgi:cation transport regulator ChaC